LKKKLNLRHKSAAKIQEEAIIRSVLRASRSGSARDSRKTQKGGRQAQIQSTNMSGLIALNCG
jgi:hypothetical protein